MWNPETIALVQHAVRAANGNVTAALAGEVQALAEVRSSEAYAKYREYADAINEDAARKATLRGLLQFRDHAHPADGDGALAAGARFPSRRSRPPRRSSGGSARAR